MIAFFKTLPASWRCQTLKHVADFRVSNVDKLSNDLEEPVRLCNYTDVYHREFISPDLPLMEATATIAEIQKFLLKAGDVVITKDSESWDDIAVPALVESSAPDMVCGYHLAMIRGKERELDGRFLFRCFQSGKIRPELRKACLAPQDCLCSADMYPMRTGGELLPEFLLYFLLGEAFSRLVVLESMRVAMPKVNREMLAPCAIPIPPLAEQTEITGVLRKTLSAIDSATQEIQTSITLLREKRSSLISAAVTGEMVVD